MTLQEIDDALGAWNNRLAAVAQNLLELQADSTYKSLSASVGGSAGVPLTGVTAQRVRPALNAMQSAFQYFHLLQTTIDRAAKVRDTLPALFGGDQKIAEIEQLLRSRSIEVPADAIPLEERTLLSGAQISRRLSPDELLDAMMRLFTRARDTVFAVSEAWTRLAAEIDRAEAQIRSVSAHAATHRPAPAATLESATQALEEVRALVQADPLGASDALRTRVQPELDRLLKLIEADDQLHRKVLRARRLWDDLVKLHREALAAAAETRTKIRNAGNQSGGPLPDLVPEAKLDALRAWLERLECKTAEGLLDAVGVGLVNWEAAAAQCMADDSKACAAHRAPVEARAELRGRLDALKAKARAYSLAESPALTELATQAEALLYSQPTDLARAAAAVAAYDRGLRNAWPQHSREEA
jgi:hypothetical protein